MSDNAIIPIGPNGVELRDLDSMFRFARCYIQSGLAPKSFTTEQQLVIAWAKAAELGLSPLQATDGMSIIGNRVGIMGDLALAMVRSKGLLMKKNVKYSGEGDNLTCEVTLQRKGDEEHVYSYSVKQAKHAQIYDRSPTWRGYPERMTYYRALGFGLRDEFSDVLKGMKIIEELQDYADSTYVDTIDDEAKIVENRAAEEQAKEAGVKFVASTGERPTPAQAAEPAFDQDKPSSPAFAQKLEAEFKPRSAKTTVATPTGKPAEEDDLDMTPAAAASAQADEQPGPVFGDSGAGLAPARPAWMDHVIASIEHNGYLGKKIGELEPKQLAKIESQWIPRIKEKLKMANAAQLEELPLFEEAIAYSKLARPW